MHEWPDDRGGTEEFSNGSYGKRARRARADRNGVSSVHSPLETYLREINEVPLLNAREEKQLGFHIQEGDPQARDRMIRANLRLVVNIARKFIGSGLGFQDLIQEGNIGLMRAVEGFDPAMNTRFSTYASYWIKQKIKGALVDKARTIRIPAYMVELLSHWRKTSDALKDQHGRAPTDSEIAQFLALPAKKVVLIKKAQKVMQARAAEITASRQEAVSLLDLLPIDKEDSAPDIDMIRAEELNKVHRVIDAMEKNYPREVKVLRLRFGLDDEEPMTLKAIGKKVGLTRERVRQIEDDALNQLRKLLRNGTPSTSHRAGSRNT